MNIEQQLMYQALASSWGIALRIPPSAQRSTVQNKFYIERRKDLAAFGRIAIRPGPEPDTLWLIREPDAGGEEEGEREGEGETNGAQ